MTAKKKRNLFEELKQGILEVNDHKAGKITLRTHKIEKNPCPKISPEFILATREKLHMSRAVFALKLRVPCARLKNGSKEQRCPMTKPSCYF